MSARGNGISLRFISNALGISPSQSVIGRAANINVSDFRCFFFNVNKSQLAARKPNIGWVEHVEAAFAFDQKAFAVAPSISAVGGGESVQRRIGCITATRSANLGGKAVVGCYKCTVGHYVKVTVRTSVGRLHNVTCVHFARGIRRNTVCKARKGNAHIVSRIELEITAFYTVKRQSPSVFSTAQSGVLNFCISDIIVTVIEFECILAEIFKTIAAKRNRLDLGVNTKPNTDAVTFCNGQSVLHKHLFHRRCSGGEITQSLHWCACHLPLTGDAALCANAGRQITQINACDLIVFCSIDFYIARFHVRELEQNLAFAILGDAIKLKTAYLRPIFVVIALPKSEMIGTRSNFSIAIIQTNRVDRLLISKIYANAIVIGVNVAIFGVCAHLADRRIIIKGAIKG